jgi:transposase-like protein
VSGEQTSLQKAPNQYTGGALAKYKEDVSPIIQRYLSDETSLQIAQSHGITVQALSDWLLRHHQEEWQRAQVARAIALRDKAEDRLETAADALELARAREQLKSAQWQLEKLCRRLFGQDQPPSTPTMHISIGIARQEPVEIQGEYTQVTRDADNSLIDKT